MKKLFILPVLILTFQFNVFSQMVQQSAFTDDWELAAARSSNLKLNYENIEGSPYYSARPVDCVVTLIDGSIMNLPLRYDLFLDAIELKKDNQVLWISKKDIRSIEYGNELIAVSPLPEDTGKLAYFFVHNPGKYSLYVKKSVAYNPYVPARPYADPIPAKFVDKKDEYYLKPEGKDLVRLSSKKDLAMIFSDNKSALDFIKKEKISHNKQEDLQKLLDFVNK